MTPDQQKQLLNAARAQQLALDYLLARLSVADRKFNPTQYTGWRDLQLARQILNSLEQA